MDSDIRLLLSKTEDFGMTEKQKKRLGRIIAAFVLFVALLIAEHTGMLENVNVWDSVCGLSGTVSDHRV